MQVSEPSAKYMVSHVNYKQTEAGIFPVDWKVQRIKNLSPYITSGSRGWARFYSDTGSPFIRITNLTRTKISPDLSDLRLVAVPSDDAEAIRTKLQENDVLISITADIGIIGHVSGEIPSPSYINQHIALVRFEEAIACPRYIAYFLASKSAQATFAAITDSGAKAGINLATVGNIPLALPPTKEEQQAIATALSDTDALIDALEQLLAKKRQVKQGAMQELLTGKVRLDGFSSPWGKKKMADLAEIRSGGTPSTTRPEFWDGTISWCTPTDITALKGRKYLESTSRKITPRGLKSCSAELIPANSIVMTSRATIGECAITRESISTNQGFKNLTPYHHIGVDFLYYALLTQTQGFLRLCSGSTFLEISKNQLATYEITVPTDKAEQTAIAAILSDMDTDITDLETRLGKVRQVKQGMMRELLTGRTRLV